MIFQVKFHLECTRTFTGELRVDLLWTVVCTCEPVQCFLLQNMLLNKVMNNKNIKRARLLHWVCIYTNNMVFHKLSSTNHDDTEPESSRDKFLVHFGDLIIRWRCLSHVGFHYDQKKNWCQLQRGRSSSPCQWVQQKRTVKSMEYNSVLSKI